MTTIDGHTFDETLLTGGWVIDAGCRGFSFSNTILELNKRRVEYKHYNYNVFALDIENFSEVDERLVFKQAALTNHSGETECYLFGNGTANFIKGINGEPGNLEDRPVQKITVPCITLQDIYNEIGTDIDLLKLDIEGSEYEVLLNMEPIPRQITVEFHQHCHPHLHEKHFKEVIRHLYKDYHFHAFNMEPDYHYLDCLFISRDVL